MSLSFRKPNKHFVESTNKPANVDVVLLVTDNQHEVRQTLRVVLASSLKAGVEPSRWVGKADASQRDRTYYFGQMGAHRVVVVQCAQGGASVGASSATVRDALTCFPTAGAVVAVGVCGGVSPKKQMIGDVVVSKSVVVYDAKKASQEGTQYRGSVPTVNQQLLAAFSAGVNGWDAPKELLAAKPDADDDNDDSSEEPSILVGPVFSGETLMDSKPISDQLLAHYKGIAFEMEGAGIHAVCDGGVHAKPWIVVKAITDFGAAGQRKSEDAGQEWGAAVAAQYVEWVLSKPTALSGLLAECKEAVAVASAAPVVADNATPATIAKDFFAKHTRLEAVHEQFYSGDKLRRFADKLGFLVNKIDIFCQKPAGEGVRDAFDTWLKAGHTMDEFVDILVALENKILARTLGADVLALYDAKKM